MSVIDLNLGGVSSAGKPLPEGEYLFLIEEGSVAPAASGTSQNLKLKMSAVEPVEQNGRNHMENLNIQESTMPFVKAFITALEGVDDDEINDYQLDVEGLAGRHIIGVVKHIESNGSTYGNVVAWKHAG